MMSKITKLKPIIFSFLGVVLMFFMESIHSSSKCIVIGDYQYENICRLFGLLAFISIPILFFATISLFVKNEAVYNMWRKYTLLFLVGYLLLVIITPWYWGDGFMSIQKDVVAFSLSGLYTLISLILIAYKSYKLRGK